MIGIFSFNMENVGVMLKNIRFDYLNIIFMYGKDSFWINFAFRIGSEFDQEMVGFDLF